MTHQFALVLETPDDGGVGILHERAGVVRDFGGEATFGIHRTHDRQAVLAPQCVVVLAEAGGCVHDAGAVAGGDEARRAHPEGTAFGMCREIRKQGFVSQTRETGPGKVSRTESGGNSFRQARDPVLGENVFLVLDAQPHVGDVGTDRERQVARQGPRCRRPRQEIERRFGAKARSLSGVARKRTVIAGSCTMT